jgi:TolB protein
VHVTKPIAVLLAGLGLGAGVAATPSTTRSATPWRIALASDRYGGNPDVFTVNADGSGARRLTQEPWVETPNAWSPDGRKLLYYTRAPGGHPGDVAVMNADGTGKRRLTRSAAFDCCGTWSPDGRRIAFVSDRDGNGEVYVMNADGSGQRNLSTSPASQETSVAWSPDGQTIAFVTDRDGNNEIYAMNADGSDPRNLTTDPGDDGGEGGFSWSPDSQRIAFGSTRDTHSKRNLDLYVMNADGSGVRRLSRTTASELAPVWSPDGRALAFGRHPVQPRWAFFVMTVEGGGVRKVTWSLPGKGGK